MARNLVRTIVLALAAVVAATTVWAAGGSSAPVPQQEPQVTPEQEARQHYNQGIYYREKAWKLEKQLADATDKDRQKLERKIEKNYGRAIGEYEDALRNDPNMYQAASDLGYALRKTGRYTEALQAYDHALSLEPSYAEAIEYRAEAYLALNRLEEVKSAYVQLFGSDRARADELLAAMHTWVKQQRSAPGEVDAATLDSFASWVDERTEIAGTTTPVSELRKKSW